jgi:hypothetical protein
MSLIFKGGKHCLAISVPATLIAWLSHGCSLIPVIFSVSSLSAGASLPSLSWQVVYRQGRHQRFRPIFALLGLSESVPSLDLLPDSLRQPLIGQALVGTSADHTVEPVHGTALDVAVVQTEGKFVNISAKMLMTNLVIDTSDPALECPVTAHACERGEFNHGL